MRASFWALTADRGLRGLARPIHTDAGLSPMLAG